MATNKELFKAAVSFQIWCDIEAIKAQQFKRKNYIQGKCDGKASAHNEAVQEMTRLICGSTDSAWERRIHLRCAIARCAQGLPITHPEQVFVLLKYDLRDLATQYQQDIAANG